MLCNFLNFDEINIKSKITTFDFILNYYFESKTNKELKEDFLESFLELGLLDVDGDVFDLLRPFFIYKYVEFEENENNSFDNHKLCFDFDSMIYFDDFYFSHDIQYNDKELNSYTIFDSIKTYEEQKKQMKKYMINKIKTKFNTVKNIKFIKEKTEKEMLKLISNIIKDTIDIKIPLDFKFKIDLSSIGFDEIRDIDINIIGTDSNCTDEYDNYTDMEIILNTK
jgi:hypothetical protein